MERLRISAVIALVIYFLSTSLIITEGRGFGAEEQSGDDDGEIPHAYLNSSLTAAATSSSVGQVNYKIQPMNHRDKTICTLSYSMLD